MMRWSLLGTRKLMICLLVLAVITLGIWTRGSIQEAKAATTPEGFEYVISNSVVTITDYTGTNKDVIIPTTIEGSPVTSIGSNAFRANRLTSVMIPGGVTSIGSNAFFNNRLTSVTIPASVTSIGYSAFSYNQLASVTIPASVTSIGYSAFRDNRLTSVMVEGDSTAIGTDAFGSSTNTSMIAFDLSPAKTYAFANGLKFLNILSYGVSYSPNGESVGKEQISTNVNIKVPDAVSVKAEYKWSNSDTTESWNIGEGTTFYSGDTITTPTATVDWYLHVRVDDEVHTEGYSHSNAFKVLAPLSNNADLSSLVLSSGSLSPTFTSGTFSYTASVANSESNIKVT